MMETSVTQPFYLFPHHSAYTSYSYLEGNGGHNKNHGCRPVHLLAWKNVPTLLTGKARIFDLMYNYTYIYKSIGNSKHTHQNANGGCL